MFSLIGINFFWSSLIIKILVFFMNVSNNTRWRNTSNHLLLYQDLVQQSINVQLITSDSDWLISIIQYTLKCVKAIRSLCCNMLSVNTHVKAITCLCRNMLYVNTCVKAIRYLCCNMIYVNTCVKAIRCLCHNMLSVNTCVKAIRCLCCNMLSVNTWVKAIRCLYCNNLSVNTIMWAVITIRWWEVK